MNDQTVLLTCFIPLRDLPGAAGRKRSLDTTAEERARIAEAFDLVSLSRLSISYELKPESKDGWRLNGVVSAALEQACVVTLDPVPATVEEAFTRHFTPDAPDPFADIADGLDIDMDAEDPPEALGAGVDVAAAALEALSLSLDPYPRAPDAVFESVAAQPEGAAPITDESLKPFAGLAALKKSMETPD